MLRRSHVSLSRSASRIVTLFQSSGADELLWIAQRLAPRNLPVMSGIDRTKDRHSRSWREWRIPPPQPSPSRDHLVMLAKVSIQTRPARHPSRGGGAP
jgi:hypothetical protein